MTGEKSVQINLIHGNGGGNEAKIRKSHTIAFPSILLGKNLFDHLLNLKQGPEKFIIRIPDSFWDKKIELNFFLAEFFLICFRYVRNLHSIITILISILHLLQKIKQRGLRLRLSDGTQESHLVWVIFSRHFEANKFQIVTKVKFRSLTLIFNLSFDLKYESSL